MCKKCNNFLAMPGSKYCMNCNPSGFGSFQSQVGTGPQQQAQNLDGHGFSISQQQSQARGGAQNQGVSMGGAGKGHSDSKIMKKLDKIDKHVKHVQHDVKHIKEYTSRIEEIFDRIDNLEGVLINSLGSDFNKIKYDWKEFKEGKISKKQLIGRGIKKIGNAFIKIFL